MAPEKHLRYLGWSWVVYSALVLGGSALTVLAMIAFQADRQVAAEIALVGLAAVPGIIGAIGLLRRRPWARILLLILGVLNLISFPIGTALSLYTFWVLLKRETFDLLTSGSRR